VKYSRFLEIRVLNTLLNIWHRLPHDLGRMSHASSACVFSPHAWVRRAAPDSSPRPPSTEVDDQQSLLQNARRSSCGGTPEPSGMHPACKPRACQPGIVKPGKQNSGMQVEVPCLHAGKWMPDLRHAPGIRESSMHAGRVPETNSLHRNEIPRDAMAMTSLFTYHRGLLKRPFFVSSISFIQWATSTRIIHTIAKKPRLSRGRWKRSFRLPSPQTWDTDHSASPRKCTRQ
jgi:hypothetical protein